MIFLFRSIPGIKTEKTHEKQKQSCKYPIRFHELSVTNAFEDNTFEARSIDILNKFAKSLESRTINSHADATDTGNRRQMQGRNIIQRQDNDAWKLLF
jgi:hypothetical protein